jgi:hypothetical protein
MQALLRQEGESRVPQRTYPHLARSRCHHSALRSKATSRLSAISREIFENF